MFRLSVIPLLRPLVWQGPLIPVLPETLYEYLQAPDILFFLILYILIFFNFLLLPYVVGVLNLPDFLEKEIDALIVKVDSDVIKLPKSKLPALPNDKKL